ncbi:hypothetical protein [Nitrospira moscoviensis]|uniref:hypothetical protein n=1 Tax=Nitrospira moscoviensis TaxID=42253 RepID=UPI0006A7C5F5|nr:hypothetical protein [Nitrospira moscoviensis]
MRAQDHPDAAHIRDLACNPNSQIAEPIVWLGPGICIVFRQDHNKRVRMLLEINDQTRLEHLKDIWPKIHEWQEFLVECQGRDKDQGYISQLLARHKNGMSYSEIAEKVELDALNWLDWYVNRSGLDLTEELKRIDKWSPHEINHWMEECRAAVTFFRLAGSNVDEEELEEWLLAALKHVASGRQVPMRAQPPISRQNVIDRVRHVKKRNRVEKIS